MEFTNCAAFLSALAKEPKRTVFAVIGSGTKWKYYTKNEVMKGVQHAQKSEVKLEQVTGIAQVQGGKLNLRVDEDKEEAKRILKLAWHADDVKWDEAKIKLLADGEDTEDAAAATPARPARAAPDIAAELAKLAQACAAVKAAYPFAARVIQERYDEIDANKAAKPALAAVKARELEAYLQSGVKTEFANREMQLLSTRYATARNRARGDELARLEKLKKVFDDNRQEKPDLALKALDELRGVIDTASALTDQEFTALLKDLRTKLETVGNQAPARAADLKAKLQALVATLQQLQNPGVRVQATKQLYELRNLTAEVQARSAPEAVKTTIGRRIFLCKDASGRTILPTTAVKDFDLITEVAEEICQPYDDAAALMDTYLKDLKKRTTELYPKGYEPFGKGIQSFVNPLLPDAARPSLSLPEAKAVQDYTSATTTQNGSLVNGPLRRGALPAAPHDRTLKHLLEAFRKTAPFDMPVEVTRGYDFQEKDNGTPKLSPAEVQTKVDAFLKPFRESLKTGEPVKMLGFLSTGAGGKPKAFDGQVVLFIKARKGLDASPYTEVTQEKELVLPHPTMFKVQDIRDTGDEIQVYVDQLVG